MLDNIRGKTKWKISTFHIPTLGTKHSHVKAKTVKKAKAAAIATVLRTSKESDVENADFTLFNPASLYGIS